MTIEHRRGVVALALIAAFMIFVDGTIVNLTLAQLASHLHASRSELEWVVDAYTLSFAAVMLGAGAFTDTLGAKRAFVIGLLVFIASSAVCAVTGSMLVLNLARLAQGAGSALLAPSALVLATATASDDQARHRLVGWWATAGGVGMAAGPLLGGALVSLADWRAVFAVNIVIGIPAIVWGLRSIPAVPRRDRRPRYHWHGHSNRVERRPGVRVHRSSSPGLEQSRGPHRSRTGCSGGLRLRRGRTISGSTSAPYGGLFRPWVHQCRRSRGAVQPRVLRVAVRYELDAPTRLWTQRVDQRVVVPSADRADLGRHPVRSTVRATRRSSCSPRDRPDGPCSRTPRRGVGQHLTRALSPGLRAGARRAQCGAAGSDDDLPAHRHRRTGLHGATSAAFNTSRQAGVAIGIATFGPLLGTTHDLRNGFTACVVVSPTATAVVLTSLARPAPAVKALAA